MLKTSVVLLLIEFISVIVTKLQVKETKQKQHVVVRLSRTDGTEIGTFV